MYSVRLITSRATWEKIEGRFYGCERDRVKVKGKNTPVPIYEIMGRGATGGDLARDIDDQGRAQRAYSQQGWDEAEAVFRGWQEKYSDVTSERYLGLIAEFRRNLPDADWQPISVIDSK